MKLAFLLVPELHFLGNTTHFTKNDRLCNLNLPVGELQLLRAEIKNVIEYQ